MTTTVKINVLCPKDREICVEVTEPDRYGGDYSPATLRNGDEREYTVYGDVHAGDKNFRWIRIYERKYIFDNTAEDLKQIASADADKRLAEAQLKNVRLREVMEILILIVELGAFKYSIQRDSVQGAIDLLSKLLLPISDTTALDAFAKEQQEIGAKAAREACAVVAEGATVYTQFQTVEHYKIAAFIADEIRAGKGE